MHPKTNPERPFPISVWIVGTSRPTSQPPKLLLKYGPGTATGDMGDIFRGPVWTCQAPRERLSIFNLWMAISHTLGMVQGTESTGQPLNALGFGTLPIQFCSFQAETDVVRLPQSIGSLRSLLHGSGWRACRTRRRLVCPLKSKG